MSREFVMHEESMREVAADLAAVEIARRLGISVAHARKTYVKADKLGPFWMTLAEWFIKATDNAMSHKIDSFMRQGGAK